MTGQKYTWMDAGIAALTGVIGMTRWGAKAAAIFGGVVTGVKSAIEGRSIGESIAIGVTTAVGTYVTTSNLAKGLGTEVAPKTTAIAVDGVFSTGYNMTAAAFTKERKSTASKRKTETTKVSKAKQKPKKRVLRLIPRRYWNRALNQWRTYYDRVIEYR